MKIDLNSKWLEYITIGIIAIINWISIKKLKNDLTKKIEEDIRETKGDLNLRITFSELEFEKKLKETNDNDINRLIDLYEERLKREEYKIELPKSGEIELPEQKVINNNRKTTRNFEKNKVKTNEMLGREYERYVGYVLEENEYEVNYIGAIRGVKDQGIDLTAEKNGVLYLIQCKRWSNGKKVRENTVYQLIGVINYIEKEEQKTIKGMIVTTSVLSEEAKKAARQANIIVEEHFEMKEDYPQIKCSDDGYGNKVYHLPTDDLYDIVKIKKNKGKYVKTIIEAEMQGYKRASM